MPRLHHPDGGRVVNALILVGIVVSPDAFGWGLVLGVVGFIVHTSITERRAQRRASYSAGIRDIERDR